MSESTFLKGYPAGSNITILNTIYLKGYKDPETGKYTEDVLYIIFKDLNTNQVKMQMLKSPMYRYYITNEGVDISYNRMYIPIDMVRPVECKYRDLRHSIAQETKNEDFYFECLKGGNYKNTERLFELPNVFMADRHIEDWYRFEFARLYKNDLFSITRAYLDIEADASELPKGTFPEPGQCPVNAISIVNEVNDTIYSLLLEDPKNPQMQEFKSQPGLTAELKAFVEDSVGGWKRAHRFGLDKFKYKIIFFKREIDLIKAAFDIINITKPNFLLAYNMAFDIPYLIARIIKLHYDPCKIICHPDFQQPFCSYYVDNRTEVFAERTDFATITSYTVYLDQLIQLSSRRKGQHAFGSMKLDEIGHKVAGVRKTDYSHITRDITELPKLNYKIFAFYNVMDTVVQYCIEHTVNDIEFVFGKAIMSNTRYSKVHRQTVYLVNKGMSNFYHDQYIIGDNTNKRNEKNPYDGAFVQEPYLVSGSPKVIVDGRPINLLRNAIDED